MTLHLRKRVAQVGVVIYILSLLSMFLPIPMILFGVGALVLGDVVALGIASVIFGGAVLVVAALIPATPGETWGSMWPLVGYDNAIDAIYVRGPWWQRFAELDELDRQRRINTAMDGWF